MSCRRLHIARWWINCSTVFMEEYFINWTIAKRPNGSLSWAGNWYCSWFHLWYRDGFISPDGHPPDGRRPPTPVSSVTYFWYLKLYKVYLYWAYWQFIQGVRSWFITWMTLKWRLRNFWIFRSPTWEIFLFLHQLLGSFPNLNLAKLTIWSSKALEVLMVSPWEFNCTWPWTSSLEAIFDNNI